jgi:hypothetical protein
LTTKKNQEIEINAKGLTTKNLMIRTRWKTYDRVEWWNKEVIFQQG